MFAIRGTTKREGAVQLLSSFSLLLNSFMAIGTLFEASSLRIAMESLHIRKKYMELEVTFKAGDVLVEPIAYFA